MANLGMLRGTGQREARQEVDTGTGVTRTAGNQQREGQISRGSFVNFYNDLGISTTEPAATSMRAEEKTFQDEVSARRSQIADYRGKYNEAQGQLANARGQISTAEGQIASAYGNLPDLDSAVNNAWGSYKSTLVPVRVVGKGEAIEATYYLPREAANEFIGKRGLFASWQDNNTTVNMVAKNYRNQELHEALQSSQSLLESQYRTKAAEELSGQLSTAHSNLQSQAGQLAGSKSQVDASAAQIEAYGSQIASAENQLQGSIDTRQKYWDELHNKYNEKQDKIRSIFENLSVGGA